MSDEARLPDHYDPTDPSFDPPPPPHYRATLILYDGDRQIGQSTGVWMADRSEPGGGYRLVLSQVYAEPEGSVVMLACNAELLRQVVE